MPEAQPTTILLGNTRPLEIFKSVTQDQSDVEAIKAAAQESDDVRVSQLSVQDPDNPDADPIVHHIVEIHRDRADLGNRITTVSVPADFSQRELLAAVENVWPQQSLDSPEWVECDDAFLAESVARLFRTDDHECSVGRPDGWEETV